MAMLDAAGGFELDLTGRRSWQLWPKEDAVDAAAVAVRAPIASNRHRRDCCQHSPCALGRRKPTVTAPGDSGVSGRSRNPWLGIQTSKY
jgi:hypothetical protein